MPKLTNLQIWENAIPLNRAWLEFADDEDRQRLAAQPHWLDVLRDAATKTINMTDWFSGLGEDQRAIGTPFVG